MHPAQLFRDLGQDQLECQLCPHYCRLRPGQTGLCRVRHNIAGEPFTSSYGQPVTTALEPIEKKYLFHVFPGAKTLSLGTPGCNLSCQYCINWRVSQHGVSPSQSRLAPQAIVDKALANAARCIAFTYTEPTIFFEYALDIATLARCAGLIVVAKSNGYMTPAALTELAPLLDAINIDLKGWRAAAHHRVVGGELAPVLENLRLAKRLGLWTEISTLIVPGLSDQRSDLENIAGFIATELGKNTPWHLLRFFPHYRMSDLAPTSQDGLRQAIAIGRRAGLRHVYNKDLAQQRGLDTLCYGCGGLVIKRKEYRSTESYLTDGRCRKCDQALAGMGLSEPERHSHQRANRLR